MAPNVQRQVFVPLPLLRAIERLPEALASNGITLRSTGQETSTPIVQGFSAYRALVECDRGKGHVDLSSASSWRSEMTLRIAGLRPARVEELLLAMRAAMVDTESPSQENAGERIAVCRTA